MLGSMVDRRGLYRQARALLSAAASDYFPTTGCAHSFAETVSPETWFRFGLVCSFHSLSIISVRAIGCQFAIICFPPRSPWRSPEQLFYSVPPMTARATRSQAAFCHHQQFGGMLAIVSLFFSTTVEIPVDKLTIWLMGDYHRAWFSGLVWIVARHLSTNFINSLWIRPRARRT